MPIHVPTAPPSLDELLARSSRGEAERMLRVLRIPVAPTVGGRYRHWDTLRHLEPPQGLDSLDWWFAIKLARRSLYRSVPLTDVRGMPFRFAPVDALWESLRTIDRDASGRLELPEEVIHPDTRDRFVVNSLIEEAITSSQLEGASTTRRVAVEMLRSGRVPNDKSERMIFNNYRAMELVRDHRQRELTPAFVFSLHRIVTDGTLDDPRNAGRLRTDDGVKVWDGDRVLHDPPTHGELQGRLQRLCDFANGRSDEGYVHPVVRAIVLHFGLAYDHPFEDGNGRTARALFYWCMLHEGYWLAEHLSISTILRKAAARYARAFLYTETDDNDLTYFLLHQLEVVRRSLDELTAYLRRKAQEIRRVERALHDSMGFNHRQLAILGHALKHPKATYTIKAHQNSHRITYQTARTDLLGLESARLLQKQKPGKFFVFVPVADLGKKLGKIRG